MLSSDNWGHTAYALSACATAAIDAYLLTGKPPARDKVCTNAPEPFVGQTFAERRSKPPHNVREPHCSPKGRHRGHSAQRRGGRHPGGFRPWSVTCSQGIEHGRHLGT
ncbi:alpha/beta hydrolase [Micromonospora sp. D93]|uniref:alpha/beta hydrolase n=1 Tax=Micromonospora sp. D93 TaxID=2824886 RepID=UPI0027DC4CF4|nr:alpha/beta hydrolase [Micromonospora sp. D93]